MTGPGISRASLSATDAPIATSDFARSMAFGNAWCAAFRQRIACSTIIAGFVLAGATTASAQRAAQMAAPAAAVEQDPLDLPLAARQHRWPAHRS